MVYQLVIVLRDKVIYYYHLLKKEFLKFVVVGTSAVVINFLVYYLLYQWIGVNPAYSLGYLLSFIFNYLMTSCFTFRVELSLKKLVLFCGSHIFNYLLQLLILNICIRIGLSEEISPFFAKAGSAPFNFLIVRFLLK